MTDTSPFLDEKRYREWHKTRFYLAWKLFGLGLIVFTVAAIIGYFILRPYCGPIWAVILATVTLTVTLVPFTLILGWLFPEQ
jgi:magnesium-transporting ATPase (P-type)